MVPSGDESEKTSIVASDTFKGKIKAADDAPPALVVLMGPTGYVGKQFALTEPESVIGRSIECQIFIDDRSVSRNHSRINVVGNDVTITDMGSSNKTIVGADRALEAGESYRLSNNEQIKTGNVIFKFLEQGNLEAITNKELNEKAEKDALTGAFSKGALLEKGPEAIKRSEFLNEELSILVFDLDHFKKINDNYGHAGGDFVLKTLSRIVGTKMVRSMDYFARYGGEEFVIILQGSPIKTALEVAERIRTTIETSAFTFEGKNIPVTISVGVASRLSSEAQWEALFQRADEALYKSKQSGRNRVTAAN
jgi:two-component system cell cycle response regulator